MRFGSADIADGLETHWFAAIKWSGASVEVPPFLSCESDCRLELTLTVDFAESVEKKIRALAKKLRNTKELHLSEDESVLYAWCLLATPDQRWERMQSYLRSVRSARPLSRKRVIPKSSV
jgi:hypothetical protein